jgi:hypothetical protein
MLNCFIIPSYPRKTPPHTSQGVSLMRRDVTTPDSSSPHIPREDAMHVIDPRVVGINIVTHICFLPRS